MTDPDSKGLPPIPLAALFRDVVSLAGVHRGRLWRRIRIPLVLILASAVLIASTGQLHDSVAAIRAWLVWLYPHGVNWLEFLVLTATSILLGIFHFAAMSFAFRFTRHPR
jgi:hypothetical protein